MELWPRREVLGSESKIALICLPGESFFNALKKMKLNSFNHIVATNSALFSLMAKIVSASQSDLGSRCEEPRVFVSASQYHYQRDNCLP